MLKTICKIIFESLARNMGALCDFRLSLAAKCWILLMLSLTVYSLGFISFKIFSWLCKCFEDNSFKDLYVAVTENNVLKAVCIINSNPQYVNKFKLPEGYTPFMIACANANTQLVSYMIQKGAWINVKSKYGETPFYLAAFYYIQHKKWKNATCIRELYYAGANINEPAKNQITVLQLAAIFGHTSLVKWLLVKNANLNICPHPYLLARSQGHHETASVIETRVKIKYLPY
ncbi:ankyrin-1-like [Sitophilus oryzae]|uniref:Ankyrin-1-like n=1 Tax=Sitophilus oryzae TaxID=7048 RepID=A0A6J2Y9F8_SITOR|nr:ankyrin-1-like [Sitophilus oryzae]